MSRFPRTGRNYGRAEALFAPGQGGVRSRGEFVSDAVR